EDSIYSDNETTYDEFLNIEDQTVENPEKTVLKKAVAEEVRNIIESLPDKEREIIKYRYGFYGRSLSLKEIGEIMGLTKERVRQIENRAIERIREIIKAKSPELLEINFN
ncbi:MAG: sigma-70 family RNA polymerase sigma factor, partial [Brevinematia bacterium]